MTITEQYKLKKAELKAEYIRQLTELYAGPSALTLDEIAAREGRSREYIRLLVQGPNRVTRVQSARRISASAKATADVVAQRDAHAMKSYGCSWSEVCRVAGISKFSRSRQHPLLKMYWHHKSTAQRKKQVWAITLPEYAELVGGRLNRFSRRGNGLVLTRKDKSLPYAIGNAEVVTLAESSLRTNGFAAAHFATNARRRVRILKVLELQRQGYSIDEIGKRIRRARATVANDLEIAKLQEKATT